LARSTGSRLDAITAWQLPTGLGRDYIPYAMTSSEDMHKALEANVERVLGDDRPGQMRLLVREGDTADVLVRFGTRATMIVVGSRGHGGFAGLYLGSVSAKVAEHANCPVLVVHGDREPPQMAA
jgi:nucleotide-binding universal stress UspA family protein